MIEYGGKRIPFDTGNNADTFADNVKSLGVDLRSLDFVVISHRHSDHTTGLSYLLAVNPKVKIYVPDERFSERFGIFGGSIPSSILPARSNCTNCRWRSERRRAWSWLWDAHLRGDRKHTAFDRDG